MPNSTNTLSNLPATEVSKQLMTAISTKNFADFCSMFANDEDMYKKLKRCVDHIAKSDEFKKEKELLDTFILVQNELSQTPKGQISQDCEDAYNNMMKTPSKLGYNNILALELFCDNLDNSKLEKGSRGMESFFMLKNAIITANQHSEFYKTFFSAKSKDLTAPHSFVNTAKDELDDLLSLLRSGDSKLRGSSDEYKEIKNEIKQLKAGLTNNDMLTHRKLLVSLKAISEKAEKYIDRRSDVEKNHSLTGYKGKRVSIMRKVFARVSAMTSHIEEIAAVSYPKETVKASAKAMHKDFPNHTFSISRFKETNLATNTAFTLDKNTEKSLSTLLDGMKVSFSVADKAQKNLAAFESQLKNSSLDQLRKQNKTLRIEEVSCDLDNLFLEREEYAGKVTGNSMVDSKLSEMKVAKIEERIAEIEKQKTAENLGFGIA